MKVHILGIYKIYYYCLLLCLNSNNSTYVNGFSLCFHEFKLKLF